VIAVKLHDNTHPQHPVLVSQHKLANLQPTLRLPQGQAESRQSSKRTNHTAGQYTLLNSGILRLHQIMN
jgi:hypothetical protein